MVSANLQFINVGDGWEDIYSRFEEQADDLYFRWLSGDNSLTPAEVKLAKQQQEEVAGAEDWVEVIEVPEHLLSEDEFECLVRIAERVSMQGLASLMSLMAGITIETKNENIEPCNSSSLKALKAAIVTDDTRVF